MAGYTKNREQNYEIKYLRKVLRQVDDRIQVPESVSGDSLRHLLDNVEAPSVRETVSRRPRWLSLQSGIAYAAAFTLIVALFYSTKLYRPDMISDIMSVQQPEASTAEGILLAANEAGNEDIDINAPAAAAQAPTALNETTETPVPDTVAISDGDGTETDAGGKQSGTVAVGGSGKANLVLERDEYAFYWRENDINDPDRTSPISFEVVDTDTQEIVTQEDVPLANVSRGFDLNGSLVFVGDGLNGDAAICSYNIASPDESVVRNLFEQQGELLDVKVYNDVVRVVSVAESTDSYASVELLPNCISDETCVITAFDPVTQTAVTKQFAGANGTIRLGDSDAYIVYTGENDAGESVEYTAQILFDGMNIILGAVTSDTATPATSN